MKKQTTVEWLVQEINKINVSTEARLFIEKLKNQAIQMEKEQIIDAATWGALHETGEQYYNETFNNQKP